MYEPGLLKIVTMPCENADANDYCHDSDHLHTVVDSRTDYESCGPGTAYLPHSCGEWVIGGRPEVEALIHDLQEMLASLTAEAAFRPADAAGEPSDAPE